jgi:hypothetical protein
VDGGDNADILLTALTKKYGSADSSADSVYSDSVSGPVAKVAGESFAFHSRKWFSHRRKWFFADGELDFSVADTSAPSITIEANGTAGLAEVRRRKAAFERKKKAKPIIVIGGLLAAGIVGVGLQLLSWYLIRKGVTGGNRARPEALNIAIFQHSGETSGRVPFFSACFRRVSGVFHGETLSTLRRGDSRRGARLQGLRLRLLAPNRTRQLAIGVTLVDAPQHLPRRRFPSEVRQIVVSDIGVPAEMARTA